MVFLFTGPSWYYREGLDRKFQSTIDRSKYSIPKAEIEFFRSLGPLGFHIASLAKNFRIASELGMCDSNRIAHRGCIARFGPLRIIGLLMIISLPDICLDISGISELTLWVGIPIAWHGARNPGFPPKSIREGAMSLLT